MNQIVKLQDGTYATIIREWNWQEHPNLKIYKDTTYKERLYEDFLDVELNGELKSGKHHPAAEPKESNFCKVQMTVCKNNVTFVNNLR